jgi:hypothetical protein
MKRVIFSLYIEIPDEELDIFDSHILKKGLIPTNFNTKEEFLSNYQKLIDCKQLYADSINVKFLMFENDYNFKNFKEDYSSRYSFLTTYNIINFYKLHLLYELSKTYDEILYLDFDVIPLTNDNFFDVWNLNNGICVFRNNHNIKNIESITATTQTIRSPTSKYYNAQSMLIEKNLKPSNDVINTGIIGINKNHLNQLKYFEEFNNNLEIMTKLKSNYDIFPKKIVDFFGYDNETLFSVKLKENNVPVQWLDNEWHYFFDNQGFIPKETKLVHAINKRFDIVWRRYSA